MASSRLVYALSRYSLSGRLLLIFLLFLAAFSWSYFIQEELYQNELRELYRRKDSLEIIGKQGELLYNLTTYLLLLQQSGEKETPTQTSPQQLSEWQTRLFASYESIENEMQNHSEIWHDFFKNPKNNPQQVDQLLSIIEDHNNHLMFNLPVLSYQTSHNDWLVLTALKRAPLLYMNLFEKIGEEQKLVSKAISLQILSNWLEQLRIAIQNSDTPRLLFTLNQSLETGLTVFDTLKNQGITPYLYQPIFIHLQALQNAWKELIEDLKAENEEQLWKQIEMHWFSLLLPLLLLAIAFVLLYFLYQELVLPLKELKSALKSLREGDAKVRIKTLYSDFVGKMSRDFNHVAHHFETERERSRAEGLQLQQTRKELEEISRVYESSIAEQQRLLRDFSSKLDFLLSSMGSFSTTLQEIGYHSDKTSRTAFDSQSALETIRRMLHEVQSSSLAMTSKLSLLNEKAQQISQSVSNSSQIAAQMQLIALKASIEAEKAGEHGRSFAVIAREVRTFADHIAQAMLSIRQATEETSSAIVSRIMGFEKFCQEIQDGLNEIQDIVDSLSQMTEKIHIQEITIENLHQGIKDHLRWSVQLHEGVSGIDQQTRLITQATERLSIPLAELNQTSKRLTHLPS